MTLSIKQLIAIGHQWVKFNIIQLILIVSVIFNIIFSIITYNTALDAEYSYYDVSDTCEEAKNDAKDALYAAEEAQLAAEEARHAIEEARHAIDMSRDY